MQSVASDGKWVAVPGLESTHNGDPIHVLDIRKHRPPNWLAGISKSKAIVNADRNGEMDSAAAAARCKQVIRLAWLIMWSSLSLYLPANTYVPALGNGQRRGWATDAATAWHVNKTNKSLQSHGHVAGWALCKDSAEPCPLICQPPARILDLNVG